MNEKTNICDCGKGCRKNRRICDHCDRERQKKKDLARYTYGVNKRNARKRKLEFTLTLDEFRKFCVETNYLIAKGKTAQSLSIDRKNPLFGYVKGNIQVLENEQNGRKGAYEKQLIYVDSYGLRFLKKELFLNDEDYPF